MMNHRRFLRLGLLLVVVSCLTVFAQGMKQDYLRIYAMYPSSEFATLKIVRDGLVKRSAKNRISPLDQLTLKAIDDTDLHMTLLALDIDVDQQITSQEKLLLKNIAEKTMANVVKIATADKVKELQQRKGEILQLDFRGVEIYNRFFVASFSRRGAQGHYVQLVNRIEKDFINEMMNNKKVNTLIKKISPTYPDVKPHVSLATITDTFPNNVNPFNTGGKVLALPKFLYDPAQKITIPFPKVPDFKIDTIRPVVVDAKWLQK